MRQCAASPKRSSISIRIFMINDMQCNSTKPFPPPLLAGRNVRTTPAPTAVGTIPTITSNSRSTTAWFSLQAPASTTSPSLPVSLPRTARRSVAANASSSNSPTADANHRSSGAQPEPLPRTSLKRKRELIPEASRKSACTQVNRLARHDSGAHDKTPCATTTLDSPSRLLNALHSSPPLFLSLIHI